MKCKMCDISYRGEGGEQVVEGPGEDDIVVTVEQEHYDRGRPANT